MRVYMTHGNIANAWAISASLFLIVLSSCLLGTALPFGLQRIGVDPANAGTSVQVGASSMRDQPAFVASLPKCKLLKLLACSSSWWVFSLPGCHGVSVGKEGVLREERKEENRAR